MKTLITTLLLSVLLLNQEELITDNNDDVKVLYRGFHNVLVQDDFGHDLNSITLKAKNNVQIIQNELGQYVAYPGHERVAVVQVFENNELIKTVSFQVYNAPRPSLYLCGLEENNKITQSCGVLQVRLPENTKRSAEYTIDSYTYRVDNKSMEGSGQGAEILNLERIFQVLDNGDVFKVEVMYSDFSGVYRKSAAQWVVEK